MYVQVLDGEGLLLETHLSDGGEWKVDGSTVSWVVPEAESEPEPEPKKDDEPEQKDEPDDKDEAKAEPKAEHTSKVKATKGKGKK